ncbi:hypothetical protein F4604DRAFT_2002706 [Suillus subluteus]|nr:hypothetical protein F4604DRAFT_2002706 [Suillus subluteus]
MELPSEERSLLSRMDLNEEGVLGMRINDSSSNPVKSWTRNSGSLQHTNTPPDPSQNSPSYTRLRPTRITLNFPSQTPPAQKSSSALLPSAFESGVISLLTTGFDMLREPLPESTNAHNGGFASIVERCRQHLAPVLLMSAKSRDSSTTLDITACAAMLTDDRCREFLQQARDMKLQMDALAPHPPDNPLVVAVDATINKEDLKRSMDRHGESTRTARVGLDSGSRKDSEATLVDLPIDLEAFSPVENSRQSFVKDITLPVKQIMEYDGALSPHDPNPANVQTLTPASVPHQMAPLSSIPVEDIEMTTSLARHSANSGLSSADPQNIATSSSADSYPLLLKIPTLSMPGTWFGRQGLTRPGILNIDFAVGNGIIPAASSSRDPRHELQESDNLDTTLDKIRSVGEDWPTKGTLVVQLNIETPNGRSWLPYELEKGALNVTPSITQGSNTLRLIHLSDLSDFTFVLYALSPELPKRAEPLRGRCWASKITQPDSEIPFDTTNIIQQYANIPVIVS